MSPRLITLAVLAVAVGGCSDDEGLPDANWPDLQKKDAAADLAPPDQSRDTTVDCPTLGDAGQLGWRVAHVAQNGLREVACAKGHLFAAGDKATLLHRAPQSSLCSGFVQQQVPTTADLLTVSFADLSYGVTGGKDHQIWETKDAGKTWVVAPQCGDIKFSAFHDLHLHSNLQGFGAGVAEAGGAAYKIFAGHTWICPNQTFTNQLFYGTFRHKDEAWLVGDTKGRIYYTPDEAYTWFFTDTSTAKPLWAVAFTPAGVGVAVGEEGVIMRTEDGMIWSKVMTLGTDDLRDVFFLDDKAGWTVGQNGAVMHTEDAGQTWTYQIAPTTEQLEGVCFTSATEGWAVGAAGTILATITGGK